MSKPSWDIKYLEDVERRLRDLEARVDALAKAPKAASVPVDISEPTAKRRR